MSEQRADRDWSTIDWNEVRSSLRLQLASRLDPGEISELDDLVQEGCVRVMRAHRRESIQDLQGMVVVIALRTFRDWLRRRYRHERLWSPLDSAPDVAVPAAREPRYGDLVERIEFMVMEIFRGENRQECLELARAWFDGRNWKDLAQRHGVNHATMRKRWSRCLELPRRHLAADAQYADLFGERE